MKVPTNENEMRECQAAIDDMINSFEFMKTEVSKLEVLLDDSLKINSTLKIAGDNLIAAIKNIHITLNANNECFNGNAQVEEMMRDLAKFIMSNEAIKAGVRSNAIN